MSSTLAAPSAIRPEPIGNRSRAEKDEPPGSPLALFGFEFSLRTATLDSLEDATRALDRAAAASLFGRHPKTEEVALLSTCHRVELLLLVRSRAEADEWRRALPGPPAGWVVREGTEVVHHLFRVAAGAESLAPGEGEVRQQVRAASRAVQSRHPRPILREMLVGAAAAADEVAPMVPSSRSIAAVAVERLRTLRPGRAQVLVIGSGVVGRQAVEALAPVAEVTILYHAHPPDDSFLHSTGARSRPLQELSSALNSADVVVTAAKFGNHGLHAADLPRDRPLVLVDLGMPRNIDPEVRTLPNVRLLDLEELHAHRAAASSDGGWELAIEQAAASYAARLQCSLLEPWVDAFRRRAEEVRRVEVARAREFMGVLDPDQVAAIDRLSRRLVSRLMLAPTERLRALPAGPEGDRQRELAVALLRPSTDDP